MSRLAAGPHEFSVTCPTKLSAYRGPCLIPQLSHQIAHIKINAWKGDGKVPLTLKNMNEDFGSVQTVKVAELSQEKDRAEFHLFIYDFLAR
jgi:hypothetical protein